MARATEFETIGRFFAPLSASAPGAFNLENDAALWRPADGCDGVVTTDCMVAGVHFLADDPPGQIAAKLLAVNLSDLAAMGAAPSAYTLAVAWPDDVDDTWIGSFADGLGAAQERDGIVLLGGDTVATPGPLTLSLTAFGEVPKGGALRRDGAGAGENVYVTGCIGDAALGLKCLREELGSISADHSSYLIERYRLPRARTSVGTRLPGLATAAIDVSDGLAADLGHLARHSHVAMHIQLTDIPLSPAARAIVDEDSRMMAFVLGGGDDYELVFTTPPDRDGDVRSLAEASATPISKIGETVAASGRHDVAFFSAEGDPVEIVHEGFRHF